MNEHILWEWLLPVEGVFAVPCAESNHRLYHGYVGLFVSLSCSMTQRIVPLYDSTGTVLVHDLATPQILQCMLLHSAKIFALYDLKHIYSWRTGYV